MTGNSSTAGQGAFNQRLLECVEDINKRLLPGLGRRYDMTVIVGALAEHLGSALKVLRLKKVCDAGQVHQVIESIDTSALPQQSAQPKAEGALQETEQTPGAADGSKSRDSDP